MSSGFTRTDRQIFPQRTNDQEVNNKSNPHQQYTNIAAVLAIAIKQLYMLYRNETSCDDDSIPVSFLLG